MGSLNELDKAFNDVINDFKSNRKVLCNQAGSIMKNQVIDNINSSVKDKTGNLKRGVTLEVGSRGGYAAVKPDYDIAPHTHLIEDGHRLVKGGSLTTKRAAKKKKTMERVRL